MHDPTALKIETCREFEKGNGGVGSILNSNGQKIPKAIISRACMRRSIYFKFRRAFKNKCEGFWDHHA